MSPQRSGRRARQRSVRSARGVQFAQVRATACALPGVEEGTSYGTPALKVRGKLLVRMHQDGECLVLRASALDRQILEQSDPETFFHTDHYRDYPWVLVRLVRLTPTDLPGLIERAWRLVAPPSLQRSRAPVQ